MWADGLYARYYIPEGASWPYLQAVHPVSRGGETMKLVCSHCYCKKDLATKGAQARLVCCRCRDRVVVGGSQLLQQHRLYPTMEEERAFREAKEHYGLR